LKKPHPAGGCSGCVSQRRAARKFKAQPRRPATARHSHRPLAARHRESARQGRKSLVFGVGAAKAGSRPLAALMRKSKAIRPPDNAVEAESSPPREG
jgi:hypothetical protein